MLHRIDRRASGTVISIGADDQLQIELGENPTTGYRWRVDHAGDVLEQTDSQYARGGTGVGAGGQRTITFRPVRAGTALLRMQQSRGEDSAGADATDRFELTVRVSARE